MTPYRTSSRLHDPVTALRMRCLGSVARASLPCIGVGLIGQTRGWAPGLFALTVTGFLVMLVVAYRWYRWELKTLYETHLFVQSDCEYNPWHCTVCGKRREFHRFTE